MSFTEKTLKKIEEKHGERIAWFKEDYNNHMVDKASTRQKARCYLSALENENVLTVEEARAIFCYITL